MPLLGVAQVLACLSSDCCRIPVETPVCLDRFPDGPRVITVSWQKTAAVSSQQPGCRV